MPFSQGQVVNFIWLEKQQTSLDHQYLEKAEMVVQGSLYQACLLYWMVVPSLEMLHLINKQQHLMSSPFPLVLHLPPQIQTDLLHLACFKTGTLLRRKEIRLSAYPHCLCRLYWCANYGKKKCLKFGLWAVFTPTWCFIIDNSILLTYKIFSCYIFGMHLFQVIHFYLI